MKSAIFKAPREFEIVDRELPVPGRGQVLVKIMASGICGSDMAPYVGKELDRRQPGIVMGHEASGIVESTGEGVVAWKKGDRVAINPQIYCETCRNCRTGNSNLCDNMLLIGSSKRKFLDGAMCQFLCLSEKQLLELPGNVGFNEGSMLDPIGNAIRVVRNGEVGIGDTVLVIGCGAIGLLVVQTARIAGAATVIAVDRVQFKLDLAAKLGADKCVDSSDPAAAEAAIMKFTKGQGADVVINAAGFAETYELAVRTCRKRGTIVALGYVGTHISFPITDMIFKEIRCVGSTGFSQENTMVLEYLSKDMIKVDDIITDTLPLESIKSGFDRLLEPGSRAIKVIINPNPDEAGA
jgi:L-iditol 2-dehydrogenase